MQGLDEAFSTWVGKVVPELPIGRSRRFHPRPWHCAKIDASVFETPAGGKALDGREICAAIAD
jgi:hypothetical protein